VTVSCPNAKVAEAKTKARGINGSRVIEYLFLN